MSGKGIVLITFDAPETKEFLDWAHNKHMQDVSKVPGITRVRRFEVVDGPEDRRRFLSITEYDDLETAVAYRKSNVGKLPQQDADSRGVSRRYLMACQEIFSVTFPKASGEADDSGSKK
ncbi:MAG: hypothetical protein WDO72_04720 [Pseudomonadota bacterium]